jgi:undecaprenyl-diphosphatase
MYWASNRIVWAPFYAFLIYLLFLHYRKQAWILVPMAILLIVFSDQTSVHFFKDVFHRLRPCHEPSLAGLVRLPDGKCGGEFGFVSSHATNSFALAVFIGYFLNRKIRHFMAVMLIWASVICYSRIYMGVHFPGDVIAGAAWGSLLAAGMIRWSRNLILISEF